MHSFFELNRISQATGQSKIGVRIHWLYFNEDSPQLLEQAGFSYDSSFGYNDAVGYRAGTLQAFRPQGAQNILELPLHIQDTVLFSHRRMNLSEIEAWNLCKELIKNATISGGALTVLWHQRSLAPERLWGDFYIKVLDELRAHNVWFATAAQVIEWFRKRRSLTFEEVRFNENSVQLKLKNAGDDSQPRIMLRIHHKNIRESGNATTPSTIKNHVDIPFRGEGNMEISFSGLTKSI